MMSVPIPINIINAEIIIECLYDASIFLRYAYSYIDPSVMKIV